MSTTRDRLRNTETYCICEINSDSLSLSFGSSDILALTEKTFHILVVRKRELQPQLTENTHYIRYPFFLQIGVDMF